jgi:hypothetical protein
MRVYHLVNRKHGLENLRLRRLKIAEIGELNDPFELRSISSSDSAIRHAFDQTRSQLAASRGMLCFSAKWNNPVLWSHYAEKHRGLALGFDIPNNSLAQVMYQRVRAPYDPAAIEAGGPAAEAYMLRPLTTKFSHWRYEGEWRAFLALDDRDPETGLCFADFSENIRLREVIVGAMSTVTRQELAEALGDLAPTVAVVKARLAFQTFKVVRQLKAALWR